MCHQLEKSKKPAINSPAETDFIATAASQLRPKERLSRCVDKTKPCTAVAATHTAMMDAEPGILRISQAIQKTKPAPQAAIFTKKLLVNALPIGRNPKAAKMPPSKSIITTSAPIKIKAIGRVGSGSCTKSKTILAIMPQIRKFARNC
jgi:hypothetical protein